MRVEYYNTGISIMQMYYMNEHYPIGITSLSCARAIQPIKARSVMDPVN